MKKFYEYTIKQGDTLQMIAQRVLGDASLAFDIALLNKLDYPFITDDLESVAKNTKSQGDTLLIPMGASDEDLYQMSADPDIAIFGSDFLLDTVDGGSLSHYNGGDFTVNAYSDLQSIKGVPVLKQDLIHRLITEQGTLPYHPNFGSRFLEIIGNRNDVNWREKSLIEVVKCFRSDVRVEDVIDPEIISEGSEIRIKCTIVTPKSTFSLTESFENQGVK